MSASDPRGPAPRRLAAMHRSQVRRDPWPALEDFDATRFPLALRRPAARQWWRRAREEYGSIHEFAQLAHALTSARVPTQILGALSRLITDEARHADLCATAARALDAGEDFEWRAPGSPFPEPPTGEGEAALLAWAADAVLCSCCIGETLSRPLFETLALRITEPALEGVVRQVLKDEHLHASFGWELLGWLRERLDEERRAWLQGRLARRLGNFEKSCRAGQSLGDLEGAELVVEPPAEDAPPNLGLLTPREYAIVFYATLEAEILPRFDALGFDAMGAWQARGL